VEVSYENTFDDMVALTEHQTANSAAYQNQRRWVVYGGPLLFLLMFAYVGRSTHRPTLLWGGALGACFLFVWFLHLYRRFPRKAVEKLHREKPQKEVFCRHAISITAEGLSEETAESRHFQTWASLHDIAFTPDYIFLYNTPATAHIIPRRELGDADFLKLREEIERVRHA
jgi:hypothetical protein